MSTGSRSEQIKQWAYELGFLYCGISKAAFLESEARDLEKWLNKGHHGEMAWMENHFDLRVDPTRLVPGARSVISFALNYYPASTQQDPTAPKLAKYAYGRDYHKVIRKKLKTLMRKIEAAYGEVAGRGFVDSAPVMDKAWAKRAGIGWVGKHTNLIAKKAGSFFFLAELILDLDLEPDGPVKDYCGTCTRCLDACPTGALSPDRPYTIDGSKCISYFTIELKGELPNEMNGKFGNWAFGCDICQDVCPWNRLSKPHHEPAFDPHERLLGLSSGEWHELTEELFQDVFAGSAVKRTGYDGLKRNLRFLEGTVN